MASFRRRQTEPRRRVKANAFDRHSETLAAVTEERVTYTDSSATGSAHQQATVPELLSTGFEQLYSYYNPSLKSGGHVIKVAQTITNPGDTTLVPTASQNFDVVGPRYDLPDGEIRSCYPPQGHGDHLQILPHVVLGDPHLPWERVASVKIPESDTRHQM